MGGVGREGFMGEVGREVDGVVVEEGVGMPIIEVLN